LVDLIANLLLDFARVTTKKGEKALRARVDDVHFVQGNNVHDFSALLKLSFGALHKLGVRAHGVC
jgi:hypothetical protein